jgi:hypothetical protein
VDLGDFSALVLLDLSAVFDTVGSSDFTDADAAVVWYFWLGTVLEWFRSYLSARAQYVRLGGSQRLSPGPVSSGVPQGSVLGPIISLLYLAYLLDLIETYDLTPHCYADDTQIIGR